MLIRILRYIKGYVRIRISGYSPERFLNLCKHRSIPVWGLLPGRNYYEMNITISGVRKIKPIVKKTGTSMRIIEKRGLPFFVFRNRKRKIFFAGAAGSVLLIYILSLFIWSIEINGNYVRTDETILSFLRGENIRCGMAAATVDCDEIVQKIRKEYDDIIWVSVSRKGSKIRIDIKENSDAEEITEKKDDQEGTDLVADKNGVIRKIMTRSGTPMVHEGDVVKKGDILVSGQIEIKNDSQETTGYQYQKADADIQIQTEETYEDSLQLLYDVKQYEKNDKMQFFLRVGSKEYVIGQRISAGERKEVYSVELQPSFSKSFLLPFSFGYRKEKQYENIKARYEKEEYQKLLSERFERFCEELRKKGVQILENNVKIYKGTNSVKAKGTLILLESCGKERKTEHGNLGENNANTGRS